MATARVTLLSMSKLSPDKECIVLGAGAVGACCALALQEQGFKVTLIDRNQPGSETSYGNGGVLARSSLIPLNNPALPAAMPRLLRNNTPQLRFNPFFVLRNLNWGWQFIRNTRAPIFRETIQALDTLIQLSSAQHQVWMQHSGIESRLRDTGWIFLYRQLASFNQAAWARDIYQEFDIQTEVLSPAQISELEPSLSPVFEKALWIKSAQSVDSPAEVVRAYVQLFAERGGVVLRDECVSLDRTVGDQFKKWKAVLKSGAKLGAANVVVALGPWSAALLKQLNIHVPMAFERGYHQHFHAHANATLNRPVYDTAQGYILTPMQQGIRLTTGVELTDLNAPSNLTQLQLGIAAAKTIFPLGEPTEDPIWRGARPTLPDSRPVIGEIKPGLWGAFGHQHIGFSTSAGTGQMIAGLMAGAATNNSHAFRWDRF